MDINTIFTSTYLSVLVCPQSVLDEFALGPADIWFQLHRLNWTIKSSIHTSLFDNKTKNDGKATGLLQRSQWIWLTAKGEKETELQRNKQWVLRDCQRREIRERERWCVCVCMTDRRTKICPIVDHPKCNLINQLLQRN